MIKKYLRKYTSHCNCENRFDIIFVAIFVQCPPMFQLTSNYSNFKLFELFKSDGINDPIREEPGPFDSDQTRLGWHGYVNYVDE